MKNLILLLLVFVTTAIFAQERIDGTFPFETDPNKKYSLYIPSDYDASTPHRFMLGLHPLNTNRWDAEAWCDTLIVFAETNNLILACPDGGVDGAVDDPIDLGFTDALLDSMNVWYNIDGDKTYAMGFSWGAKTTYTYGLDRPEIFKGYLPIGSAMSGTSEVNSIVANAADKPVYIVHGNNDTPSQRYTPIKNALENNGAIVNSNLMPGVGHTIDFPNRNAILTTAFQWIDSVNCANVVNPILETELKKVSTFTLRNNPITNNQIWVNYISKDNSLIQISVLSADGKVLKQYPNLPLQIEEGSFHLELDGLNNGLYFLQIEGKGIRESVQFVKI